MLISLKTFTGEMPRMEAELLPDNAATLAMNVDFSNASLRGQLASAVVDFAKVPNSKTGFVYRTGTSSYLGTWFVWDRDVDVLRSPVTDDQYNRFYWMDGTQFCVSQGDRGAYQEPQATNKWKVGVPQPVAAPQVTTTVDYSRTLNPNPFTIEGVTYTPTSYNPNGSMNGTMVGATPDGRVFNHAVFSNATKADGVAIGMSQTQISDYFHDNLTLRSDSFPLSGHTFTPLRYFPDGTIDFRNESGSVFHMTRLEATGPVINCPESIANAYWNWTPPISFAKILTCSYSIANERADGSLIGSVDIGIVAPDAISTENSKTYTLTPTGFVKDTGAITGTSGVLSSDYQPYGTATFLEYPWVTVQLYYFAASGTFYFKRPDGIPNGVATVTARFNNGISSAAFYLIGGTQWYASDTVSGAPVETTTTASSVVGQVITATITLGSGIVVTAKIRANAVDSSLPVDIDGTQADYTENSDGTYTVNIWTTQANVEARAYCYTYVNVFGEEGSPSDPATLDTVINGLCYLQFSAPPASISGFGPGNSGGYAPVSAVRIYRTATGSQGTSFLFAKEITLAGDYDTVDSVRNDQLGEAILTQGYLPPDQDLRGLRVMANGMFVAFKDKEVHFSEPYLPYAWKRANIKQILAKVMGICPLETSLYVTTAEIPVVLSGVSGDTITESRLPATQQGVSKNSIAQIGTAGVAWVSPDGIAIARGMDVSLDISQRFFTRDTWREFCKDSNGQQQMSKVQMRAHNGYILIWFDEGAVVGGNSITRGLLIRHEGDVSLTRHSDFIIGGLVHQESDGVYVSNGQWWLEYAAGPSRKAFSWQSKVFVVPSPTNFGAIQFKGTGEVSFTVTCDDVYVYSTTKTLTNSDLDTFRLPAGFKGSRWQIRVDAAQDAQIKEIHIANTVEEIKRA